jgi:hypothetical protein
MGGPEPKQDRDAQTTHGPRRDEPRVGGKPGGATRMPGTDPIAAYAQSLRVGNAAYSRLMKLLDELESTTIESEPTLLDARRALREIDRALEQTRVLPIPADPRLDDERKKLVAKRTGIAPERLDRLRPTPMTSTAPVPKRTTPPPPPTGTAPPRLRFAPGEVAFRQLAIGKSQTVNVKVTNLESRELGLDHIYILGGDFEADFVDNRWVILPGQTVELAVTFKPSTIGDRTGTVYVGSRGGAMASFAVNGRATAKGSEPLRATKPAWNAADEASVKLHTEHQFSVEIVSAEVLGDGGAYIAQVRSPTVFPPYDVSNPPQIDLYYDHTKPATSATLRVKTDDGGLLDVPLEAPGARNRASTAGLELSHTAMDFGSSEVHTAPDQWGRPKKYGSPSRMTWVSFRNRGTEPVIVKDLAMESNVDRGFLMRDIHGWDDTLHHKLVQPNQSIEVLVYFMARDVGAVKDRLVFWGPRGQVLAAIDLRGVGEPRMSDEPAKVDPAAHPAPKTEAEKVALTASRKAAHDALNAWNKASGDMIHRSEGKLHADWSTYLTYAAANPQIPTSLLPGAGAVANMLSNAFGNALNDGPLDFIKKAAEKKTGAAATKLIGAAGATLMATGAGFVVGVLIETAAGLLWNRLTGDHDDVTNAHQDGYKDGSERTGGAIKDKVAEIHNAAGAAIADKNARFGKLNNLIDATNSTAELDAAVKELAATTKALATATPLENKLAAPLLRLWVTSQAASTSAGNMKVSNPLWKRAVELLAKDDPHHHTLSGKLKNQPGLFIAQCMTEWQSHGLVTPPDLEASFRRELALKPADLDVISDGWAETLSKRLMKQLDRRQFVWDPVMNWPFRTEAPKIFGPQNANIDVITSQINLDVEDGCCVVDEFLYTLKNRTTGATAWIRTAPGKGITYSAYREAPGDDLHRTGGFSGTFDAAETDKRAALYSLMGWLGKAGTTFTQVDAAAVQRGSTFGRDAFRIAEQSSSGRAESLIVFRVAGKLHVPDAATYTYPGVEIRRWKDEVMIRGGNAILMLTPDQLEELHAQPNTAGPSTVDDVKDGGYR